MVIPRCHGCCETLPWSVSGGSSRSAESAAVDWPFLRTILRPVLRPKQSAPTVRDVYERMWEDTHALSWFLVYRMLMGYEGSSDDEAMGIAQGEGLALELGVAPRYTMELRISVGAEGQG